MKTYPKYRQAFKHDPDNGIHGDCWRTALSYILRIDRDEIPHEHRDYTPTEWRAWTQSVAMSFGLRIISFPFGAPEDQPLEETARWAWNVAGGSCLIAGVGPRGVNHSIAIVGPHAMWDPSPSDEFIVGPCEPEGFYWLEMFVPQRPASVVARQVVKGRKS